MLGVLCNMSGCADLTSKSSSSCSNGDHDVFVGNGYVQRRIWDYFVRNLLEEPVPAPDEFRLDFAPHEVQCMLKKLMQAS